MGCAMRSTRKEVGSRRQQEAGNRRQEAGERFFVLSTLYLVCAPRLFNWFRKRTTFKVPTSKLQAKAQSTKYKVHYFVMTNTDGNLLEVKELRVYFDTEDGEVKAV